ncbi:hypothetical protein EVAR_20194_1 [Eumeta japonica]|uniref:Uncharacterized protein n=1 Tax=Eumeta variegata TaxID=151549 RepID=A0A4C1UTV2_EUMVA|nr:hypothetical protein EVAR_20194_1 [Eumeta japonica]
MFLISDWRDADTFRSAYVPAVNKPRPNAARVTAAAFGRGVETDRFVCKGYEFLRFDAPCIRIFLPEIFTSSSNAARAAWRCYRLMTALWVPYLRASARAGLSDEDTDRCGKHSGSLTTKGGSYGGMATPSS